MMALLTLGNILLLIDSTLRVNFNLFRQCRLCGPLPYSHKFMFQLNEGCSEESSVSQSMRLTVTK